MQQEQEGSLDLTVERDPTVDLPSVPLATDACEPAPPPPPLLDGANGGGVAVRPGGAVGRLREYADDLLGPLAPPSAAAGHVTVLPPPPSDPSVSPPPPTPPSDGDGAGDGDGASPTVDASEPAPATARHRRRGAHAAPLPLWRVAVIVLSCLLLTFLLDISVVGSLRHSRDQSNAYAHLRDTLANSEAPVGPTDFNGKLLSLGTPVAILEIPSIHMREVVREGTTSGVLIGGPGHLRNTVLPGQSGTSVILGRASAYGGPFASIGSLEPGALVLATTGQGRQGFRVVDVRHGGDPLPPAATTGSRITLVTAGGSPYLPSGLLEVDADRAIDSSCPPGSTDTCVQPTPAQVLTAASLSSSELALHGDSSALVPLVLWLQALLVAAVGITWLATRRGKAQAWLIGVPVLLVTSFAASDQVARLLPNLM